VLYGVHIRLGKMAAGDPSVQMGTNYQGLATGLLGGLSLAFNRTERVEELPAERERALHRRRCVLRDAPSSRRRVSLPLAKAGGGS
jgi:hypothetical protein